MPNVYILHGESGSRSNEDEAHWTIAAYDNPEAAEQHRLLAQRRADRLKRVDRLWFELRYDLEPDEAETTHISPLGWPKEGTNPWDLWMQYNDNLYYYVEIMELRSIAGRLK